MEETQCGAEPISLGRYTSYWMHRTPRRMLHSMSYYKFASRLIGKDKRVLDIGCNEGLGTFLLAKQCGFAKGLDFDEEAIACAKKNFSEPCIEFVLDNVLTSPCLEPFDAVTNFDVIEHIYPENAPAFWKALQRHIKPKGIAIVGTPSEISQVYASPISKKGHVNIYSPERLEQEMKEMFEHVFLFAANDEMVHTGYLPLAHYLMGVGCGVKT